MDGDILIILKDLNIKVIGIKKKKLGICADWFIGGNIESSWESALNLFYKISKA